MPVGPDDFAITFPGTVTVQPNAPVGLVLATATLDTGARGYWSCDTHGALAQTGVGVASTSGTYVDTYTIGGNPMVVYSTNVPGVGYGLSFTMYNTGCGGWVSFPINVVPNGYSWTACRTMGVFNIGVKIEISLVKTGPITAGLLAPGPIGKSNVYDDGAVLTDGAGMFLFHLAGSVQINDGSGTCSFTVPDTDLGTYTAASFTGSTTKPWSDAIKVKIVSCSPGIDNIHMKFLGTPDANNSNYFAPISTSGNVTGIAIQLANSFMAPAIPGGTLDWSRSVVGDSYNLRARFVQTLGNVTAGVVKTPITIQFTYN